MKKTFLLFLFVPALFFSCGQTDKKSDTAAAGRDSVMAADHYYMQYQGTIGGQPVTMHVVRFGSTYDVNYTYDNDGQIRDLLFQKDSLLKNDSLFFTEFAPRNAGNGQEDTDPQLRLVIHPDRIDGFKRIGEKDPQPVALLASRNGNAFIPVGYLDSIRLTGFKQDTPSAFTSLVLLEPGGTTTPQHWFTALIKRTILATQKMDSTSLQTAMTQFGRSFIENFRDDVDTMKASGNGDEAPVSMMHYDQQISSNLVYNNHGYAVLSVGNYAYTGGAHGMYGQTMLCLDMKQQRELTFRDVLTIDSATLQPILEHHFRARYKIADNKPLTEILFDERLALTDNFYFTPGGIGFIYQPYEVAAYAFGLIDVWVPYADLKPWLQPAFAQRMGI
ncbi:DUF3298 and DUF4163 domain-containing protein [Niabella drilacis]|uniref:DUF3298 domain-containing protein n=1 Tax=Niabella drilacis (strain DSM 25811 / CCM 8410 / CCUG 62505 / LMG 26954 / E90) TaxID=1285928 RepID=A0A1G6NX56_NIADE|nr:DUF3298 and DUF4163 domain-containing protein [Niabella drilacis]SDC71924.1 protein of unknown function [Niabella drilacis]